MTIEKARVAFIVSYDDITNQMKTELSFTPIIAPDKSKRWEKMNKNQRILQNYVAIIASKVMDALNQPVTEQDIKPK